MDSRVRGNDTEFYLPRSFIMVIMAIASNRLPPVIVATASNQRPPVIMAIAEKGLLPLRE